MENTKDNKFEEVEIEDQLENVELEIDNDLLCNDLKVCNQVN